MDRGARPGSRGVGDDSEGEDPGDPLPRDVLAAALLTAHDLNNMLAVALLELDPGGDPPSEGVMALREAARLSRDLVNQCRRPVRKPTRRRLRPLVERALGPLPALLGATIVLSAELETVGPVRVDPPLVDHLLRNLVLNARRASPQGGTIRVKLTRQARDGEPWASLQVVDRGTGIDAAALARLGRRPVRSPRGNGIGLALLRARVVQLGGDLVVHSTLGQGTCVEVLFPCLD